MENQITTWFLVLSLVLPRVALFVAWISDNIPKNNIPFIGDMLMAILVPRILILIYIYDNLGAGVWFYIHLVFLFIAWIGGAMRLNCKSDK